MSKINKIKYKGRRVVDDEHAVRADAEQRFANGVGSKESLASIAARFAAHNRGYGFGLRLRPSAVANYIRARGLHGRRTVQVIAQALREGGKRKLEKPVEKVLTDTDFTMREQQEFAKAAQKAAQNTGPAIWLRDPRTKEAELDVFLAERHERRGEWQQAAERHLKAHAIYETVLSERPPFAHAKVLEQCRDLCTKHRTRCMENAARTAPTTDPFKIGDRVEWTSHGSTVRGVVRSMRQDGHTHVCRIQGDDGAHWTVPLNQLRGEWIPNAERAEEPAAVALANALADTERTTARGRFVEFLDAWEKFPKHVRNASAAQMLEYALRRRAELTRTSYVVTDPGLKEELQQCGEACMAIAQLLSRMAKEDGS